MINFILWLLFGALVGWLASLVMRTDAQQGAILNIVVGIVGAFLGGLLFSFLPGSNVNLNDGNFSLWSLFVSFIGAVVLLGIVNLFSRGRVVASLTGADVNKTTITESCLDSLAGTLEGAPALLEENPR